ncbi:MAG TPA: alpha-ribazole phosphatase family protein [Bacteroidota bacterium]|nr:alpha-ribazole phosphatase family protein [Bacteroidota bacterium]
MEILLIRHTTPDVPAGTCYGQSDLDVAASFNAETEAIRRRLPEGYVRVVSSPLRRCRKLAAALFPGAHIEFVDALKEIDCGEWEMKKWDELAEAESRAWAADFVHRQFPGGENYLQLSARVVAEFERIVARGEDTVIVAHGGVIRSVLAHVTCRPLAQSFETFTLPMGCVYRLRSTTTGFVIDAL